MEDILKQKMHILEMLRKTEIPASIIEEADKMTYVELRGILNYILRYVSNATTKTVIQDIIKTLTKMEYTSVSITPTITKQRIKQSRPLLRF